MNLDEIRQILELVREHDLSELELERDGLKIRVRKAGSTPVLVPASSGPGQNSPVQTATAPPSPEESAPPPADSEVSEELAIVKSPIVGTFYRASEPGAPPFVEVGDRVKKGQVLCIIEAMKLMNEIDSECDGEIAAVYVENGLPVQYGERLFSIRVG